MGSLLAYCTYPAPAKASSQLRLIYKLKPAPLSSRSRVLLAKLKTPKLHIWANYHQAMVSTKNYSKQLDLLPPSGGKSVSSRKMENVACIIIRS